MTGNRLWATSTIDGSLWEYIYDGFLKVWTSRQLAGDFHDVRLITT